MNKRGYINVMRFPEKVLLRPEEFTPSLKNWEIEGIFNPGAIRLSKSKKIILYIRVSERAHKDNGKFIHCPIVVPGENNVIRDSTIFLFSGSFSFTVLVLGS